MRATGRGRAALRPGAGLHRAILWTSDVQSADPQEAARAVPGPAARSACCPECLLPAGPAARRACCLQCLLPAGPAARSAVRPGGGWGNDLLPRAAGEAGVWAQPVPGETEKGERWSGRAFPQDRQTGVPQLWKGQCRTFLRGAWTEGT